ncbi:hypothetical protein Tco_0079152 [Tanacetum coccineum]
MEGPVEILEREFKKLKRSRIPIVKVFEWKFINEGLEYTWGNVCSSMLCDLDFEPLLLSLSSLPSYDLVSLTNMLILLHYLESFKSELGESLLSLNLEISR